MMTILFDEAEARGQARGEAIGQTRGEVMGAIRIYATEMHLSPSEIIQKIMTRFSLKQEEAEQFVSSVLNQEKK